MKIITLFLLFFCAALPLHAEDFKNVKMLKDREPQLPTYEELVHLADHPHPAGILKHKVDKLFRSPFVSNQASRNGVEPRYPEDSRLGRFMRVMSWNIEKSLNLTQAIQAFTRPKDFALLIDTDRFPPGTPGYEKILYQRSLLNAADVIILEEMDWGVKRSGYRHSPKDLAEALNMNYAFAPAYLEIDKVNLGIEKFNNKDGSLNTDIAKMIEVDRAKYKGLFGSAVLSRYPILAVKAFPLIYQGYDWYEGEKNKYSLLEIARRKAAEGVFLEKLFREMKVGGRNFLRVDLYVPWLPEKRLTVINIHLEIKCLPEAREMQIREILNYIRDIRNPVVMMGDFNAAPADLSPTTVKREARRFLTNPSFWFSQLIRYATPQGATLDFGRITSNLTKNFQNPTAPDIPIIAPNNVYGLFKTIRDFRFNDGYAFDFRGNKNRSTNHKKKMLANSNERDRIGYRMTFTTERTIFQVIGKYRLDWAFVKGYITDPLDKQQTCRFAPHFGKTLEAMNDGLRERISDHHPNIVDIPFEEPRIKN